MASAPTTSTPAAEALLGALADRPGASAAELAAAAGIGRSTAGKLLATLAAQGRVERQPGGLRNGRRTADRWTGAVGNALRVLAGQGAVVQTQAKPRRYTIAPADGGDHAEPQR